MKLQSISFHGISICINLIEFIYRPIHNFPLIKSRYCKSVESNKAFFEPVQSKTVKRDEGHLGSYFGSFQ